METPDGAWAIVAGADAPVLALSRTSKVGGELRYFNDASFASAAAGYAPSMQVLSADDLSADLTDADRCWLISLGSDMDYNLKYWRPGTVGEVIFNTWD